MLVPDWHPGLNDICRTWSQHSVCVGSDSLEIEPERFRCKISYLLREGSLGNPINRREKQDREGERA